MSAKWKIVLILSLAFDVAVLGTVAYGWSRAWCERRGCPVAPLDREMAAERGKILGKRLGVSGERAEEISRLLAVRNAEGDSLQERCSIARRELVALLDAPTPDERAIMAKVDEIGAIQAALEKRYVNRLLEISKVLTPEEKGRLMHLLRCRCCPVGSKAQCGPTGPEREGEVR